MLLRLHFFTPSDISTSAFEILCSFLLSNRVSQREECNSNYQTVWRKKEEFFRIEVLGKRISCFNNYIAYQEKADIENEENQF